MEEYVSCEKVISIALARQNLPKSKSVGKARIYPVLGLRPTRGVESSITYVLTKSHGEVGREEFASLSTVLNGGIEALFAGRGFTFLHGGLH